MAVYIDSSALVKLVVLETDSDALAGHLHAHPDGVSCSLARVEVIGAVRAHGQQASTRATRLLQRVSLVRLDDLLLDEAPRWPTPTCAVWMPSTSPPHERSATR